SSFRLGARTRLAQKVAKIPFGHPTSRHIVQAFSNEALQQTIFFGLLEQVGDSRLAHLLREQFEGFSRSLGGRFHDCNFSTDIPCDARLTRRPRVRTVRTAPGRGRARRAPSDGTHARSTAAPAAYAG